MEQRSAGGGCLRAAAAGQAPPSAGRSNRTRRGVRHCRGLALQRPARQARGPAGSGAGRRLQALARQAAGAHAQAGHRVARWRCTRGSGVAAGRTAAGSGGDDQRFQAQALPVGAGRLPLLLAASLCCAACMRAAASLLAPHAAPHAAARDSSPPSLPAGSMILRRQHARAVCPTHGEHVGEQACARLLMGQRRSIDASVSGQRACDAPTPSPSSSPSSSAQASSKT